MLAEERRRILNMLAEGKLNAEQADELLEALSNQPAVLTASNQPPAANQVANDPKYLRVLVEGHDDEHPGAGKVNVRVPFRLIRAGVRLAALLPTTVHGPINRALHENGVDIDISKIKPENLEELVAHLRELEIDVEGARGEKVRVFCE